MVEHAFDPVVRVHIADDREAIRLKLRHLVDALPGYTVSAETVDGPSTVNHVCVLCPDLVLVRPDLPLFDGFNTTRTIKMRMIGIGIIMILDNPCDVLRVTESGADGYVASEDKDEHIPLALETVAYGGAWISPRVAEFLMRGGGLSALRGQCSPRQLSPGYDKLTAREREVFDLVVDGCGNREVASALGVSIETVKVHMRSILKKLEAGGRLEAVSKLLKSGYRV